MFLWGILGKKDSRVFHSLTSKSHIAQTVRAARLRAGLTQAELTRKLKTTQSVIARLESGTDKRTPSLDLLARIASACDAELELGFKFAS